MQSQPTPPTTPEFRVTSQELDLTARRELALRATDVIAEVLEAEITVTSLERMATSEVASDERLHAKRAIRVLEAVARRDSEVVKAVGETGLYHFAECVIEYGADEKNFLKLMGEHGLTPEEVTSLYDIRKLISDHTNGRGPGFAAIQTALASVGISLKQAAEDTEVAISKLSDAGYFVEFKGQRTLNQPIFSPLYAGSTDRLVENDVDGSISQGIISGQMTLLSRPHEEIDDEIEGRTRDIIDELRATVLKGID